MHQVCQSRCFERDLKRVLARAGVKSEAEKIAAQERAERIAKQERRRRQRVEEDRRRRKETMGRPGQTSGKSGKARRKRGEE